MDRQDFWFPAELESLGAAPTGTRAGQFLFLSGQTPRNTETGKVIRKLPDLPDDAIEGLRSWGVHGDGREGPINAQTWQVYQNLSRILESQGSSLEHIVRQRLYLTDWRDIRNAERVMQSFFPGEKPATTIARMTDNGYHDDYRIIVEVVALAPEEGGLTTPRCTCLDSKRSARRTRRGSASRPALHLGALRRRPGNGPGAHQARRSERRGGRAPDQRQLPHRRVPRSIQGADGVGPLQLKAAA